MELKVIDSKGLQCKVSGTVYKKGETFDTDDIDRVNDLISRKLCVLTSIEPKATVDATITFKKKEYDLKQVKDALISMGITVAPNAGATSINKKLGEFTEEQTQALTEILCKE